MCGVCRKHLQRVHQALCPFCGVPSGNGFLCHLCKGTTGIQQIISVFHFKQKGIQELVHALKYENIRDIAPWMGRCMTATWHLHGYDAPQALIPIPLHRSRLREREYNQSALLARSIQNETGIPVIENILVRSRKTQSQTELSVVERKDNVRGCFSLAAATIPFLSVVLIDDVFTTGATLCEAASVLKSAGVQSISALTFAHD